MFKDYFYSGKICKVKMILCNLKYASNFLDLLYLQFQQLLCLLENDVIDLESDILVGNLE